MLATNKSTARKPRNLAGLWQGTGWVFDNRTAIDAQVKSSVRQSPHLLHTTIGGKTFNSCGELSPVGTNSAQAFPKLRDGTLFWLVNSGLIPTTDKGKTWKRSGEIKDAQYGPIFGKSARHMFVLTKSGPAESTDSRATWSPPLTPPQEMKGIGGLSWLEYDPRNDALYLMKMGSDLYRLPRGK